MYVHGDSVHLVRRTKNNTLSLVYVLNGKWSHFAGGTNGLGKATVRVLAKRGAHVYLAARNLSAAEKVKEEILKETPSARIDLLTIDLASLESERTAAKEFLALNVPLLVLVCNAGIGASTFELSVDGVEIDFATNYLGHVLLTQLLLDKLKATASESGIEGRIVNVSSNGHELFVYKEGTKFDEIYNPDKTNVKKGSVMDCLKNYGQSKLAQILCTKELAKRLQGAGLQAYLAISPDVKGVTGKYFDNYKEYPLKESMPLTKNCKRSSGILV